MNFLSERGLARQSVSGGGISWLYIQTYTYHSEQICEDSVNSTNRIGSIVVMEIFYVNRWEIQYQFIYDHCEIYFTIHIPY